MMGAVGLGIIELVILMGLGGGGGIPLGVPPAPEDPVMFQFAPDDCLYYATWAGIAAPSAESENSTERMIAGKEMMTFLSRVDQELMNWFDMTAAAEGGSEGEFITAISQLVRNVYLHHTAVCLERFELGDVPEFYGAMLIKLGDEAQPTVDQFREAIAANLKESEHKTEERADLIVTELRFEGAPLIEFTHQGDYIIIGFGEDALNDALARMDTDVPDWLQEMRQDARDAGIERLSTISRIDVESVLDAFEDLAGRDPSWTIVENIGLKEIKGYQAVTGLDQTGFVSRIEIPLADDPQGLFKLLEGEGMSIEDLDTIPANVAASFSISLSPEQLLDVTLELFQMFDPFSAAQLEDAIEEGGSVFGARIREDIIASLGDQISIYASSDDGGFITGWVFSVEVKDHMSLTQVDQKLVQFMQEAFPDTPGAPSIHTQTIDGREVHTLIAGRDFMPFTPAWSLTGSELIIAPFAPALKSHIRQLSEENHLASAKPIQDLFDQDESYKVMAVSNIDQAKVIRFAYPWFEMMMQFAMTELGEETSFDVGDFPSVAGLTKEMKPANAVVYRTEDSLLLIARQTIPSGDFGATMPVIAAVSMPAVFSARAAASRIQSANNMRQMGIALHNYHDVHRALPPPYTVDEEGKPLLSWRVHILPYVEAQALYDRFHLDEPWDSEHNRALISEMPQYFALPGADPGDGLTPYQGVDIEGGIFGPLDMGEVANAQRGRGRGFDLVRDGLSNTIMLVETNQEAAVIWTKPGDFEAPGMQLLDRLNGNWEGGFNALMGDASLHFIDEAIDAEVLIQLFKMGDGEPGFDWEHLHDHDHEHGHDKVIEMTDEEYEEAIKEAVKDMPPMARPIK